MADPLAALQAALFEALSAGVTLAPVFQHVPPGTFPPVVIIAEDAVADISSRGGRLEQHDQSIVTMVRGSSKQPLRALQEQVRAALHQKPIAAAGAQFTTPVILSTSDQLLEDGATYYGVQRFRIFVQPAG